MSSRLCFLACAVLCLAPATSFSKSQQALISGAFTDVPPSAQRPEYVSLVDGSPLHILSGITGAEFHVPGKISSQKGGLSTSPHPILRRENGVSYWFISGELSGYVTEEFGQHILIGPTDLSGANHRNETFCAPCSEDWEDRSLCCEPGEAIPNPRAGLPGAMFWLAVPTHGFNGALVELQAGGDGGTGYPGAVMYSAIETTALLDRGYALFAIGAGGTVPNGELANGERAIDTNPYSGSDILWSTFGEENTVPYARFCDFDESTAVESTYPSDFELMIQVEHEEFTVPFGDPFFFYGSLTKWNPEFFSDGIIFAKNLMKQLFPKSAVTWTAYLAYSRSGTNAVEIASSTRAGAFQVDASVGPQVGGGNYRVWGVPKSGLRFDAILSYAGLNEFHGYVDREERWLDSVNEKFPIAGNFVWFVPEYDAALSTSGAYQYANRVWQALTKLGRGTEINQHLRIYSLPKTTHNLRDTVFASFDHYRRNDGLWYEYRDALPNLGALNGERNGIPLYATEIEYLKHNPLPPENGDWDFFYQGSAKLPRLTALWLQTLENLRANSRFGIPLPVSRVDAKLFTHLGDLSTETARPDYAILDLPVDGQDELVASLNDALPLLERDSGLPANSSFRPPFNPGYEFNEDEVRELKIFGNQNALKYSTKPIGLPDVAVSTGGPGYYVYNLLGRFELSKSAFLARYRSLLGYKAAFTLATLDLIDDRLWEPEMGISQILEVLSNQHPWSEHVESNAIAPATRSFQAKSLGLSTSDHFPPAATRSDSDSHATWRDRLK